MTELIDKIIELQAKGFQIQFAQQRKSIYVGLTTWAEQNGDKRIVDGSFLVDVDVMDYYRGGKDEYIVLEIDRHLKNVFTFLKKEGVEQTSPP